MPVNQNQKTFVWYFSKSTVEEEISRFPWLTHPDPEVDRLCSVCSHINFRFLFTTLLESIRPIIDTQPSRLDSQGIVFGTIQQLRLRQTRCSVCSFVWRLLSYRFHMDKVPEFYKDAPTCCWLTNRAVGLAHGPLGGEPDDGTPSRMLLEVTFDGAGGYKKEKYTPDCYYIACDDPLIGSARLLGEFVDYKLLSHWIRRCEETHENHSEPCPAVRSYDSIMTHFIDVGDYCVVEGSTKLQFAALSYVWGGAACITLTQDNAKRLKSKGGLMTVIDRVPRTIRDAIKLCQQLKIRHLWVDGLCIPQDTSEKLVQIQNMHLIYLGSFVTLIAAAGSDADAGLAGVSRRVIHQNTVKLPGMVLSTILSQPPDIVDTSVWNTRAWTLQERLLSDRMIVFTEQQVHYYCRHGALQESYTLDVHDYSALVSCVEAQSDNYSLNSFEVLDFDIYSRVVFEYTHRSMSYEGDVINALEGLTAVLGLSFASPVFVFGLPAHLLDIALLWRPVETLVRRVGWPSWSWVGWIGGVAYGDRVHVAERSVPLLKFDDRTGEEVDKRSYMDRFRNVSEDGEIYYTEVGEAPGRWHCRPVLASTRPDVRDTLSSGVLSMVAYVADMRVSRDLARKPSFTGIRGVYKWSRMYYNTHCMKILDGQGVFAGAVFVDDNVRNRLDPRPYRFVCISRSTLSFGDMDPAWDEESNNYAGEPGMAAINPQDVNETLHDDGSGPSVYPTWCDTSTYNTNICWPLYNVLMVGDDKQRLGVGKIHVHAFDRVSRAEQVYLS